MPRFYSDHHALVAIIYAEGGGGGIKAVLMTDAATSHLPPPRPLEAA
jgi:hypothetical protein